MQKVHEESPEYLYVMLWFCNQDILCFFVKCAVVQQNPDLSQVKAIHCIVIRYGMDMCEINWLSKYLKTIYAYLEYNHLEYRN